jgi:hypothetical protein
MPCGLRDADGHWRARVQAHAHVANTHYSSSTNHQHAAGAAACAWGRPNDAHGTASRDHGVGPPREEHTLEVADSGSMMPPTVFVGCVSFSMTMRLSSGTRRLADMAAGLGTRLAHQSDGTLRVSSRGVQGSKHHSLTCSSLCRGPVVIFLSAAPRCAAARRADILEGASQRGVSTSTIANIEDMETGRTTAPRCDANRISPIPWQAPLQMRMRRCRPFCMTCSLCSLVQEPVHWSADLRDLSVQ